MSNNVKITTKINPLNLLAPHSCRGCESIGEPICNCCKKNICDSHHNFCPICKTPNSDGKCQKHPSLPPTFVVDYRHGLLGQLIHEYKYNSVRSLSFPLASMIDNILPDIKSEAIIVPLPTIDKHIRERALDHTLKIAKHLARLHHGWQVQKILTREKNTVQVGSSRKTRLSQASSAYSINPKITLDPNTTYILFDDVWTTGASVTAAIKKLRASGAQNIIVALLAVSKIN